MEVKRIEGAAEVEVEEEVAASNVVRVVVVGGRSNVVR
jgi:hypothetical protein